MTALRTESLTVRYGATTALHDVSLDVEPEEVVCVLGPSGSGKSTLLRAIAGLERPAAGRILIGDVEVSGPSRFVEPDRRRVGMVFQDYALFPHLTVRGNVAFGLRRDQWDTIPGLLDRLGLAQYRDRYPHMLSGGEQQRLALARAIAPAPRILLMDEPFSSLDQQLRGEVRRHTMDFIRDSRVTAIIVTHDADEAGAIADRIALLERGRLVRYGPPEAVPTAIGESAAP